MKKRPLKSKLKRIASKLYYPSPPQIFIISYPKSGRTWLRTVMGKYLSLKYDLSEKRLLSTGYVARKSGLPRLAYTHDEAAMLDFINYRDLSQDKLVYTDKKVLLMGRGIKDTLVSAYFQATKRVHTFDGSIAAFIRDERFGIEKIVRFYEIWLKNMDTPKEFLYIQYEDMHADTTKTLRLVLHFIGETDIDDKHLHDSIEFCSFKNLKKMESQNKFNLDMLKPKNSDDPESFKVRKGKVDGFKEYLSEADIQHIDHVIEMHGFSLGQFPRATAPA